MTSILDEKVIRQLATIRSIATALSTVSCSPRTFFSLNDSELGVSDGSAEDTATVLSDIGQTLATAAEELANAVETQLVEFFDYMREEKASQFAGIFRTSTVTPENFKAVNQQVTPTTCTTPMSHCSDPFRRLGGIVPQSLPLKKCNKDQRAASTSIQTCLFLLMESVLTQTNATRAAVYLGNPTEKPRILCRVAHIHADDKLPPEVCCVSTSALVTAMRSGLAINFDNRHKIGKTNKNEMKKDWSFFGDQTHHSLQLRSGIIVPLGNYGCVVVADKPVAVPQVFTSFDEHLVWGFAIFCEGLFLRYPFELFVNMRWSPVTELLRPFNRLPPISQTVQRTVSLPALHLCSTPVSSVDTLLSVPKKLTVMRGNGTSFSFIQNRKGMMHVSLTPEELFQDAAKYIGDIEFLLTDITHELSALKLKLADHDRSLDKKQSRIFALEAEVRRLNTRNPSKRGLRAA